MELEPFIIQSEDDLLSARVSLEALLHPRPGVTFKNITPDGGDEIVYKPRYAIDEPELLSLVDNCDFATHRVVAWTKLVNESEKLIEISCYTGTIASLERFAKAIPLQPTDEELRLKAIEFERDRSQMMHETRETVREATTVYRQQPTSANFQILLAAETNLVETEKALNAELRQMQEHHAMARHIRKSQQALGWQPEPDQTEKRIIMGAVNDAVQNLENLYLKS